MYISTDPKGVNANERRLKTGFADYFKTFRSVVDLNEGGEGGYPMHCDEGTFTKGDESCSEKWVCTAPSVSKKMLRPQPAGGGE